MFLDCANGVGAPAIKQLKGLRESIINIEVYNDEAEPTNLNEGCGAEYVHKD